ALPLLSNTPPQGRLELFAKKIHFCCYVFNFENVNKDLKEKELKRIYLEEIIEFMEDSKGILIEPIYAISFAMFSKNVFRSLPPKNPDYDPDEDDPISEPAWPHLSLVYAFFIRLLESPDFHPSQAKQFLDRKFVQHLIGMFSSDDLAERENLKTILHRIYGKFLGLRAYIRSEINIKFQEVIYEDLNFPGATEILEVLGSIINGYAFPLKQEHVQFLFNIILPLHTSPKLQQFQAQLVYCVVQYIEKDPGLTERFTKRYLKLWPKTVSSKEVMFLGELEEIIDILQPIEFAKVHKDIFSQLAKCIRSEHFQVAERALYFWDNEYIVSLIEVSAAEIFPLVLPSLIRISSQHWNDTIVSMGSTILKNFMSGNQKFFTKMVMTMKNQKKSEEERRTRSKELWSKLEKTAEQRRKAIV
uniref:Serine/threonine protein phosphatase 2A regulatory subunit n=1 Tax=Ciona savignyi TaxID=51511 RepID=H2Z629_CIOSA